MLRKISNDNKPIIIASFFILVILIIGSIYTLSTTGTLPLLQPSYLLQQLQIGSFLGLCAAGMMLVILLGHIDLSIPWTIAAAAMVGAAVGGPMAIPVALGVGLLVGLVNGFGVAYLRIPSMIFTLGMDTVLRGLMVTLTGGAAPQDRATDIMVFLGTGKILGFPVPILVWGGISILIATMLVRTGFGKSIYSVGSKEAAAFLSGIRTKAVIIGAFVGSSVCAALAGVLLAGFSSQAYQGMGNEFLLPAIAAVVLGGTHILGGRGRYLGTVIGVILLVLLNSVLSIMQMPEAYRQIIYGSVIVIMLLIYGRGDRVTS